MNAKAIDTIYVSIYESYRNQYYISYYECLILARAPCAAVAVPYK